MGIHQKKITNEIKRSTNKSRGLWKNIDSLRKMDLKKNEETNLFSSDGQKLEKKAEKEELVRNWKIVYQKHANDRYKSDME